MDDLDQRKKARDIFKKRVEEIEKQRGKKITQMDIFNETGVSQHAISGYMRGNVTESSYKHVTLFLRWLGISPEDFARELGLYD